MKLTKPTPEMIRALRQKNGLTQRACAEKVGCDMRTWRRYESLERKISSIPTATWKLFKILTERTNA